jgi:hypothetical protein
MQICLSFRGKKEKNCFTDEDKGNMHKTGKMVKQ